jgi:hypothetical protein
VHDSKVGGANHQATLHEIDELYPSVANQQEWSGVAHLQQVPRNGDLGEGADAAIKANEQVGLGEEAQPVEEIGRIDATRDRLIGFQTIP